MEELVFDFDEKGSLTPIDIVSDITGLTYEEIRSCSKCIKIDVDEEAKEIMDMTKIDPKIMQGPYTI